VKPGWATHEYFLAGYGAAQAVPGPLFTFGAYLGAAAENPVGGGIAGAAIALVAIFLPGMLLQLGALPFWSAIRGRTSMQAAMRGINAAVVGLLAAALFDPVWSSAVLGRLDFAIALTSFILLIVWRTPALLVVGLTAAAGTAVALLVG
jgi:chromate transporter